MVHDLLLDFCRRRAEAGKKLRYWHRQLLNGFLKTSNGGDSDEAKTDVASGIVKVVPRRWWMKKDVPEDGYIHGNVARHLSWANRGAELGGLLLDARWTEVRTRIGGVLGLKSDFDVLDECLEGWEGSEEVKGLIGEVREQFGQIFKAVQVSWGRTGKGRRAFQFQVCGHLEHLRKSSALVDVYLKSLEKWTPKPILVPVSTFFGELDSGLMMEIPLGGQCCCVASSACGQYICSWSWSRYCGCGKWQR